MKRPLNLRNAAKAAGALALGLIVLDVIASVATVAFGAELFKR